MLRKLCFLVALVAALLFGAAWVDGETWTDVRGLAFEAEFLHLSGGEAVFLKPTGRRFSTPLEELSLGARARIAGNPAAVDHRGAKPDNFGRTWPREVRVDGPSRAKVVTEDRKTGRYVYESPGYRFTSNARITDDALRNFSMMFESTHKYARALPLALNGGAIRGGRLDIRLFATADDYHQAGGTPGSSGCYVPASGVVLVPMPSLGLVRGSTGFHLDRARRNHVLIHELAHQLTPAAYMRPGVLGWFSEGVADYIAVTPYTWGCFRPDVYGNAVKSFVTARGPDGTGGRALGTRLKAPKLREFFLLPYTSFSGPDANFNYGFALLLTHYFFHMQGEGKARRITGFLRGIRAGQTGELALAPLLGGSTYDALEADFAAQWRKLGVEIRF